MARFVEPPFWPVLRSRSQEESEKDKGVKMGRLIEPISQEEFEKLPKWKQWTSNHWYLFPIVFSVIFIVTITLVALGVL
jgi:hypothetical protein